MKEDFIAINGTNYPVIFTLLTLSNFEEITNKGFFEANLNTTKNRMAMIMAAALAADEDTSLTIEELRGKDSWEDYVQISKAYAVVMKLADDFFPIPEVEQGKDLKPEEQEEEGDKSKN